MSFYDNLTCLQMKPICGIVEAKSLKACLECEQSYET